MPISHLPAQTLVMRFRHWDRNQNGYLERADIEASARRLGEAFGRAPQSPEQRALDQSCRRLWEILARRADIDLDGRIGKDEFVAAFSDGVLADPGTFDRVYRTLLENVVDVADTTGDGVLNREEYLRLMRTWYDAHEIDAVEAFRRLDRDGDGLLSREDLLRSATDFYLSDDPVLPSPPPPRGRG